MRAYVIQAHPVDDSYNSALLGAVRRGLEAGGYEVTVARLASGDDPALVELVGHQALAFVYPTWWGGQPAVLLDWLQRRMGPYLESRRRPAALTDVLRLAVVTTHGSSRLVNRLAGEPGRQLMSRGVGRLCGSGLQPRWIALYKLDRTPPAGLEEFVARVERELARP